MKYVLAFVALSYALECLALALTNPFRLEEELIQQSRKIRDNAVTNKDAPRRIVEALWFVLYMAITVRLLRG